MPIYEFHCVVCQASFEELVLSAREAIACPTCGGTDLERAMSVFSARGGERLRASSGKNCSGCSSGACSSGACSSCSH